jgi:hypothetical protein
MVGVSALAVILVAAVAEPDPNWARIRAMPPDQRSKLLQGLKKFDLELTPEKQEAIRELDRQLAQVDPQQRARYFWVLRRYHDWLDQLPENKQEEILALPADDRLASIRKLAEQYPVSSSDTSEFMRIAEVGELSPFELASVYKIWELSSKAQHDQVEREAQGRPRRKALLKLGNELRPRIPRETIPKDFDDEYWIGEVLGHWRKTNPVMAFDDLARNQGDDTAKAKQAILRQLIHHRQAINLYTSRTKIQAVAPENLTRFVTALPSWLHHAIDEYPPDEARRRLTWAYRLLFPFPDEIGASVHSSASAAKGAPRAPKKKPATTPAKAKPDASSPSDSPF